jgi:cytochrome c2
MLRGLLLFLALGAMVSPDEPHPAPALRAQRASAGDLEIGGDVAGAPGQTRYLRYEDLLQLPQETYTVNDDSNLPRNTVISGVALTTLIQLFGQLPDSVLLVAICSDGYRTNYPRDYLAVHHPLLVLRINGKPRDEWPPAPGSASLGPYFISHPFFKPAFRVLSHDDEPQIPYGVTRIEIRRESVVFGAIRPPGNWSRNSAVEQGHQIARQDCFRCHNSGAEGGRMAGVSWRQMSVIARTNPQRFRMIIRNPASVRPDTKMPGQPGYDDSTLNALTAYFQTFSGSAAAPRTRP